MEHISCFGCHHFHCDSLKENLRMVGQQAFPCKEIKSVEYMLGYRKVQVYKGIKEMG